MRKPACARVAQTGEPLAAALRGGRNRVGPSLTSTALGICGRAAAVVVSARDVCRAVLVAAVLAFTLATPVTVRATSVAPSLDTCPLCAGRYMNVYIASWNSFMMPQGPPEPSGACPTCLFAWRGEIPKALSPVQKDRIRQAIANFPASLSSAARRQLTANLSGGRSESTIPYLINVCDSARNGTPIAKRGAPPAKTPKSREESDASERKEEQALIEAYPRMLAARRAGVVERLPSKQSTMGALFTTARLIKKRNRQAAEYFLQWVTTSTMKRIEENDLAVCRNIAALAEFPPSAWPEDYSAARVAEIAPILQYLKSRTTLPKPVAKLITRYRWTSLSDIAMAAATGLRDRAAAPLLTGRIRRSRDFRPADAVKDYFSTVGQPEDTPALFSYARRLYSDSSRESDDWMGLIRADVENTIRTIQLRALVATSRDAS